MSNVESKKCSQCGAPIDANVTTCKFCGADVVIQPQYAPPQALQYAPQQVPQYAPQYAPPQAPQYAPQYAPPVNTAGKNKTTAGVLAIIFGGLGVHKFYLGKVGWGFLYLIFCWTYIPSLIGLIEGIIYLTTSEANFYAKYVKK